MPAKKIVNEIYKTVISMLGDDMELEDCKFCDTQYFPVSMHRHDGGYVCENCWDERLRVTE
jgi:recombinational DNA repair protein (RecF pathway)